MVSPVKNLPLLSTNSFRFFYYTVKSRQNQHSVISRPCVNWYIYILTYLSDEVSRKKAYVETVSEAFIDERWRMYEIYDEPNSDCFSSRSTSKFCLPKCAYTHKYTHTQQFTWRSLNPTHMTSSSCLFLFTPHTLEKNSFENKRNFSRDFSGIKHLRHRAFIND